RETMVAFGRHYEALLRAMVADPDARISRLQLIDDAERAELIRASLGPAVERPAGTTLHGLFSAQVARTPDADAVCMAERSITYAELDRWSNAIAEQLRARGIGREERVALLADRSAAAIAGVLAVLKAGAAYLPIDPGVPADRLAWLLGDAAARLLLVPAALIESMPAAPAGVELLVIADGDATAEAPPVEMSDTYAGYVIYTSGSTGTPKGVVVEHRSAVNLALSFAESHGFAGHRVLMIPPLPFDASVGDVFPAFATGAALVLHPNPSELNAVELARFCAAHGVTAIDAPAALWRRWTEEWVARGSDDPIPALRLMMVGGESVPVEQVRRFARLTGGRVAFFNHYGPTEATVCATVYKTIDAAEVEFSELPIGSPVANTSAYVLDERLQLVPQGVAGELYLGGAGVTRGYLGRPEQTEERFLADPFSSQPGARMYATGDLVRRLPGGALLFLGRRDRQIKLRGFRIEPGEIEAALLDHPVVRGTAVMLREDHPGERRLVAYLVSDATLDPAALRSFLQERLPDYMIPAAFVPMEALPLTSNGKVDLRALPLPPKAAEAARTIVPPRDETEAALVEIWRELLAVDEVSIHDDFFAIGGDSLRTMPLVFRVQQHFGVELPLSSVFQASSVAQFAKEIEKARSGHLAIGPDLESRINPDLEIDPATIAAYAAIEPSAPPRVVLLTGGTGFLGAFLLDELLRATEAVIYCLVRAAGEEEGFARIRKNLEQYGLWNPELASRLIALPGDLAEPRLGLSEGMWDELARGVEVIYHNGSTVNFAVPYEKLERPNVGGTREVLRLATRLRIKPVHFVSTLSSFMVEELRGSVVRESDPLPAGSSIGGGYNQSKWVADRMVQLARAQGVPVSIYRPARVTGASDTGASNTADLFPAFIKGCIQLGAVPDTDEEMNMSPVDFVAAAIVRLSLHP
ncbi:MAG: linear gramicidin synthetase subunit, partial [Acidobacteria bacterium]|nr:linear gramicidin synthetase subunit [Acidobacteriota bacterium]